MRLFKGRDGYEARKNYLNVNGWDYQLTVTKWNRGEVRAKAQACSIDSNGTMLCNLFQDPEFILFSEKCRLTKNKLVELAERAERDFNAMIEAGTLPEGPKKTNKFFIGRSVLFNTPSRDRKTCYIAELKTGFEKFVLVSSDLTIETSSRVLDKPFGIGFSLSDEPNKTESEVAEMLNKAKVKESQRMAKIEAINEAAKIERQKKIAENIDNVVIPAGAIGFIIGDLRSDESDFMTDYHGSSSDKKVYLAWTFKQRDDFSEMRKAAQNFERTKDLTEEHREKYSGGHGFYLGEYYDRSGWKVYKDTYKAIDKNEIALAMTEGRWFVPDPVKTVKSTVNSEGLSFIDYSSKAFAIIGDTKPIKDKLRSLGGRFNFRLKCGPGWIFKKSDQETVLNSLNITI